MYEICRVMQTHDGKPEGFHFIAATMGTKIGTTTSRMPIQS